MKKSEKLKGKAAVATRKKQYTGYAVIAGAVIVILVLAVLFLSNPTVAKKGDTVMVFYTGTYENGTVFDSNLEREPLTFTIGNGNMIPGFEEAVIGMSVNSTNTVQIPAEKAYGPRLNSLVHVVNRTSLPADLEPLAGNYYSLTRSADDAVVRVLVLNVTNTTVTLDENHMLAGQDLTFTIRFVGFNK